jgi:hypothetical protein
MCLRFWSVLDHRGTEYVCLRPLDIFFLGIVEMLLTSYACVCFHDLCSHVHSICPGRAELESAMAKGAPLHEWKPYQVIYMAAGRGSGA